MERFKAVEKAMKTKAYSKEGLSAAAKLDPKEQAKLEAGEFLSNTVEELELQIEHLEAEAEAIQATMKKGKTNAAKAGRISRIEHLIERHKWHQGKLELIRRSLENGAIETEQVTDLEESIRYYVAEGVQDDFMEDEGLYDDLELEEEEDVYGMNQDNDRVSSQDTQSVQEEAEIEPRPASLPAKARAAATDPAVGRRPSTQLKSPLPTLATLHNPLSNTTTSGALAGSSMKPASLPQRPPGEGLKYASAAAAAAASDKSNVGIAPLPPPPGSQPVATSVTASPLPSGAAPFKTSAANSPSPTVVQPAPSESRTGGLPVPEPKPSEQPSSIPSTFRKADKASKSSSKSSTVTESGESSRGTLQFSYLLLVSLIVANLDD